MTPSTLTSCAGCISSLFIHNLASERLLLLRVKWINAVLSASKVAPLALAHLVAFRMMVFWIILVFTAALGPVTQAVKSSMKATAPWFRLILKETKSALKNRKRIGDSGDPYGSPAWARFSTWDTTLFTTTDALRS
jgi:hypothetical protein